MSSLKESCQEDFDLVPREGHCSSQADFLCVSVPEKPISKHLESILEVFLEKQLKSFVMSGICAGSDTVPR